MTQGTTAVSADLRYPVGKFAAPAAYSDDVIADAKRELTALPERLRAVITGLTEDQLDTPYRDGGWTVRQVVHHLPDSHLNAYCRFRLALTEDAPTIKPYAEALWAKLPDARTMPVTPSLILIDGLHRRWLGLLETLTPEQWERTFVHPEHGRSMTLWHTVALYGWHSRHHVAHIANLRERRGWNQ